MRTPAHSTRYACILVLLATLFTPAPPVRALQPQQAATAATPARPVSISAGDEHSLAVAADGTAWSWGAGPHLGYGDNTVDIGGPAQVTFVSGAAGGAAGNWQSAVWTSGGGVKGWGAKWMDVTFPGGRVVGMAAGREHLLAVGSDGRVYPWGSNTYGQLGFNLGSDQLLYPIPYTYSIVAVAAGAYHSLALRNDGSVLGWGRNQEGQLGGMAINYYQPTLIGTKDTAIAAGDDFSLALKQDGTVLAWGANQYGQLGNGTTTGVIGQVTVTGLTNVVKIWAGGQHALALTGDGTLWAWGRNDSGELGDGTTETRPAPVKVGLTGVTAVAAGGRHTLALTADGNLWAWGNNEHGQVGDGTRTNRSRPVAVQPLVPDTAPPAWAPDAQVQTAGITPWTARVTWTPATDNLGVKTYSVYLDGVLVSQTTKAEAEVSGLHPDTDYTIRVAAADVQGNSSAGGPSTTIHTPAAPPEPPMARIFAGAADSFAFGRDGNVWAWGFNSSGQVGDGTRANRLTPIRLTGLANLADLAGGVTHTLAVTGEGTALAWGSNESGQLGDGTAENRNTPVPVSGLSAVTAVAAGRAHSLALTADGSVWTWGSNDSGQLGGGSAGARNSPAKLAALGGVTAVAAGESHSLALRSDGTVWAWGSNQYGQLGDKTYTDRPAPVQVSGLTDVVAIAARSRWSMALRADGTVWAWGENFGSNLGDGTTDSKRPTAGPVTGLTGVTRIAAGSMSALALKSDGTVWKWGLFSEDNSGLMYRLPLPVDAGLVDATAVAATEMNNLVLLKDGSIWGWGYNYSGELGDSTNTARKRPVEVRFPADGDDRPPTWPANAALQAPEIGTDMVALSWNPAEASGEPVSYGIFEGGRLLGVVDASQQAVGVGGLKEGSDYHFAIQARDAWGNWSADGPDLYVHTAGTDKTPPALARLADGSPALLLAVLNGGTWRTVAPQVDAKGSLTFVTLPGATYQLLGTLTEPATVLLNKKSDGVTVDGLTFTTVIQPGSKGSVSFTLTATDPAKNSATLAAGTVTVDAAAPHLTITTPSAASLLVSKDATVTLAGTADEVLSAVAIKDPQSGVPYQADIAIAKGGRGFTAIVHLPADKDATFTLQAVGTDLVGHLSAPDAKGKDRRTVQVDVTAPPAPVVTNHAVVNGKFLLDNTSPTLAGTTEPLATVRAVVTPTSGKATEKSVKAAANGTFSITGLKVADGATLTLTATDAAGNTSEALQGQVAIDSVRPAVQSLFLTVTGPGGEHRWEPMAQGSAYTFTVAPGTGMTLSAAFSEPLLGAKVNKQAATVTENRFEAALTPSASGSATVMVEATDLSGNTTQVTVTVKTDSTLPKVTVSAPSEGALVGAAGQPDVKVTFRGTATEPLTALQLLDADGKPVTGITAVTALKGTSWQMDVTFPAEARTWQLRFAGTDAVGNVSTADGRGADARTLTIDPSAPTVTLADGLSGILFLSGDNAAVGFTGGKLTVAGTARDDGTGLRSVTAGTTRLTPPGKGAVAEYAFSTTVALTENKLVDLAIVAEDRAGNKSLPVQVRALRKTKITRLTATATWSKTKRTLSIQVTTDAAVKIGDTTYAVVPLTIVITDSQGNEKQRIVLSGPQDYTVATGAFAAAIDTSNWAPGAYYVTMIAGAPKEFPNLAPKSLTPLKVTVSP